MSPSDRASAAGPPLLVLSDPREPRAASRYLAEMLRLEGLGWLEERDLAQRPLRPGEGLPATVLLGDLELDGKGAACLAAHVHAGGGLLAARPSAPLLAALGLAPPVALWPERLGGYVVLSGEGDAVAGLPWVESGVQYLAQAVTLLADPQSGASVTPQAWLAPFAGQRTRFPAAVTGRLGAGRFALLAFDAAESAVRQQQGSVAQRSTGGLPDFDGDTTFRPNDLFLGQLDPALRDVPQADLQRTQLARLVEWLTEAQPLPRLWRLPFGVPAAALIDGDSDGMTLDDFRLGLATCDRYGAPFGTYLKPEHIALVEVVEERAARERGHAFGPHPWAGPRPSPEELGAVLEADCRQFAARYGYRPRIHRGHWLVWPGWTDHAVSLARAGLRLDANFAAGRNFQGGYVNGSGLPVRFATADGTLLDVAEQSTISTDDGWLQDKTGLPALTLAQAISRSCGQIDEAVERYHTVYHPYFHPVLLKGGRALPYPTLPWLESVLAHCRRREVPVLRPEQWVDWNDARRDVSLERLEHLAPAAGGHRGARFMLRAGERIEGLTVLWPVGQAVDAVRATAGGTALAREVAGMVERHGRRYAAVTVTVGRGERLDMALDFR